MKQNFKFTMLVKTLINELLLVKSKLHVGFNDQIIKIDQKLLTYIQEMAIF